MQSLSASDIMIERVSHYIELLRAVGFFLKESSVSLYQAIACLVMSALIPLHVPVLAGVMVDTMKAEQVIVEYQFSTVSMLNFLFGGPVLLLVAIALLSGLGAYLYRMSRICISDAFALELRKMVIQDAGRIARENGKSSSEIIDMVRDRQVSRQFLDAYLFQPFRLTIFISASVFVLLLVDPVIGGVTGITILLFCAVLQVYLVAVERRDLALAQSEKEEETDQVLGLSILQGLFWLAAIVGLAWLWWYGEQSVQSGQLSLGTLVMCIGLVVLSFLSLGDRFMVFRQQDNLSRRFRGMRDLLVGGLRRNQTVSKGQLRVTDGRISIKRLSHDWHGRKVLDDVSLDIAPHQITAVVSPEAASRSALMQIIAREIEPAKGRVTLDEHSLECLPMHTLRSHIAFIPETPFFVEGSIRENLCFMQPQTSHEEVKKACDLAFAMPFIEQLDDGFDTYVGPEGIIMPEDIMRRIAIARAILRRPKILLLDNPLAGLGVTSELAMINTIQRLRGKFTVVLSDSRLEKMQDADQLYLIRDGRLVHQGTPEMLIRRRIIIKERLDRNLQYCASPF